jgi:predicted nuclease of restriction endonuclease-like (RecB) superfamily
MSSSRNRSKTQNRTRSSKFEALAIQHKRSTGYDDVLTGMVELLDSARRAAARAVNSVMTATYWEVGRRIVEFEQAGEERARYGANLLERLAVDLTKKVGRGYSRQNLQQMRQFYLAYPPEIIYRTEGGESGSIRQTPSGELAKTSKSDKSAKKGVDQTRQSDRKARSEPIRQTASGELAKASKSDKSAKGIDQTRQIDRKTRSEPIRQTASGELSNLSSTGRNHGTVRDKNASKMEKASNVIDSVKRVEILERISSYFRLSWSHYVQLLKVEKPESREFYESEALRCGWTVRQLERQINTLFYERTLASRNKAAMLKKGAVPEPDEVLSAEEEIKNPYILEFLDLKDEYSETQFEEALIKQLENFLMELGSDFAFLGRQKRLKIGDEWYRIDLLFYHRRLRCLVIVDLKIGKFTHADAGQMHLYLSYAQEHWTRPDENPPVGLILCTRKDNSVVHYALDNLPNKILAAEYRTNLPDEKTLAAELEKTRRMLDANPTIKGRLK